MLGSCVVVAAASCVDPRIEPPTLGDRHGTTGAATPTAPAARPVPFLCDDLAWTTTALPTGPLNLAVAASPRGATVLAAPASGGDVVGFVLDSKGAMVTAPHGTVVRAGGMYVATAATIVNGRLITATTDQAGDVFVDLVADDLSSVVPIAKLTGPYVGKLPILDVAGTATAPTLAATELDVTRFDGAWTGTTTRLASTRQPIGMTTSQLGSDGLLAWSTTTDCHLEVLAASGQVQSAVQPFPCAAPRLAADTTGGGLGVLLFETAAGVQSMTSWFESTPPPAHVVHPNATAPRVVHDRGRDWIAYLDVRGQVVAGYLTEAGDPITTGLANVRPARDGFELAIVAGDPWVFAADDNGFRAGRMCLR